MCVSNVGKYLLILVIFKFLKKFTLERQHMDANNVGKPSFVPDSLRHEMYHLGEKLYECN
jgi:hypothetical protein